MHKHIRLILPLTLVITSTMLSHQSYANPNREAKLKRRVSKDLDAGNIAFNSKDYLKAIGHYKSAYRLVPDDQTLYKIASAYDLIPNSCEEALQTWKKLDLSCKGCSLKAKIQDRFERAQARCNVRLKITTPSPGASVMINGKSYGQTPLSIELPANKYNIEIKQAKQSLYNGELELAEGSKEKSLTLNHNGQATLSGLNSISAPNNSSGVSAQNNESGVSSRKERRSSSQERAQEQKQARAERKSENRQNSESSGRESSRKRSKTKRTKNAK